MSQDSTGRTSNGFTLIELLVIGAVICLLASLLLSVLSRSREKAKRTQCENQLHQFYKMAVMYADEHEGYLCGYEDILKQIPMICPSDRSNGRSQKGFVYNRPTSFWGSANYFSSGANRGLCLNAWSAQEYLLTEYEPYHDPLKQVGFEPGKWKGRFLTLMADGATRWPLLEQ